MRPLWLVLCLVPGTMAGQGGRDEEFYYPGRFNWSFLRQYPDAARLFNAFDYGHAVLYQRLATSPDAPVAMLEEREFNFLVRDLLRRPPKFAIAEEAVMPDYSRMAWRAKLVFERAHVLHRQIYDVYADRRISRDLQPALVERLVDYYLADRRYALTDHPKAMELMDGQYYSQVFRARYPKFNGLIWAYHWLQVGLYESFLNEPNDSLTRVSLAETVARFWAMTEAAPARLPAVMPMTAAVAPAFSARHPRAAIIFDNLHMLHDIISDILASPKVARGDKARVIDETVAEFRNPATNVIELEHWRMMADHMGGVARMGGVAGRQRPPS